jgi:glycosyltransferase involved in cell wall biosynthesis
VERPLNSPPVPSGRTVLHVVANLDRGGAQEVVRTLALYLPECGWSPVVATLRDGPLRAELEAAGVPVAVLTSRRHSMLSPLKAAAELRQIRAGLRAVVREHAVSVLQTHLLGSLDFLVLTLRHHGLPAVLWTVHNAVLDLRPDQLPPGQRWLLGAKRAGYRLAYRVGGRLADGFVAVSDAVGSAVRRTYRPPARRLFVIPNGVDTERYATAPSRDAMRSSLALPSRAKALIVVAKLYEQKGHAVLFEALAGASLPADVHVLIVGDGPERDRLERLAADRGLGSVRFLGNRPDIPDLLAASDLFVLPSLWEGLPMALLEAMAAGLAVIATDVAGSRQVVVSAKSGVLVAPGDAKALGEAVRRLLEDDAERARLASGGRERVRDAFSARTQAARHARAYDAALHHARRARRRPSHGT